MHHIAQSSNVLLNVRTDYVVTTRDKIEIALRRKLPLFLRRTAWVAPASLLSALVMSIITSDFTKFMGISEDVWSTVFVVAAILSGVWLLRSLLHLFRAAKLEDVLQAIVETHDVNDRRPLRGHATNITDDSAK